MSVVAITGSSEDRRFTVTDFTAPRHPKTVFVTPGFESAGCVVDCSNKLAAVGNYGGGEVAIYDISNPADPVLQHTFDTGIGPGTGNTGIGALSFDGTKVLTGELNGPHIVLIDIAKPPSAAIVSSIACADFAVGGVYAIALSGPAAVASGSFTFNVLNYTVPAKPKVMTYVPAAWNGNINFIGPVACSFDGQTIALGDGSGNVYLFGPDLKQGTLFFEGTYQSDFLEGVTSIAVMTVSVTQVVAGNISSNLLSLITPPTGSSPAVYQSIKIGKHSAGPNPGGAIKFFGYPNLAASTNNGDGVTYFNTLGWPAAAPLGNAKAANLASSLRPTLGFTGWEH